ncbi:MAG: hypothetical protein IT439_01425 [Phycisphaerales bacterium]|nr:hypothetical protein [Phycisphaerales bacterium]
MDPFSALKLIGAGARLIERVTGTPAAPAAGAAPSFESLLRQAQEGELTTGDPVEIDPALPLALTAEQMSRLQDAADRAAGAGASQALVRLDGLLLRLDVAARRITGVVDSRLGDVTTGIDALVDAGAQSAAAPGDAEVLAGPQSPLSASLIRALAAARSA